MEFKLKPELNKELILLTTYHSADTQQEAAYGGRNYVPDWLAGIMFLPVTLECQFPP